MAVHYDISSLDSNKTILETLHRIEKYLKENPIYKAYALTVPYVAGEQYNLTDLVLSDRTLAEGDVVFFTNNYYAYVSAVGSEVFSVANACNFKGETGAQGAQGIQGEQGLQGEDGENGVDALVFKRVYQRNGEPSTSGIIYSASPSYFSREVQQGDSFVLVYLDTATNISYLCVCHVTSTTGILFAIDDVTRVTGLKGEDGTDGANGKEALVIDRTLNFVRGSGSQQLINVQILPSNFNRQPELNEDFVAILHDTTTNIDYIAQCEIQTMNGTVVTSIVAIDIYRITGAQGQNGANGQDGANGKDALVYNEIVVKNGVYPVIGNTVYLDKANFNRNPELNDIVIVVWNETQSNSTYQVVCKAKLIGTGTSDAFTILSRVYTTGASGASSQLYMHNMSFNINTASLFGSCRLTIVTNDADSYVSGTSFTARGRSVFDKTIGANGYANADKQVVGIRYNASNQYIVFMTVPKNITEYQAQSSGPSAIYTDWQVYDTVVAL